MCNSKFCSFNENIFLFFLIIRMNTPGVIGAMIIDSDGLCLSG